MLRYIKLDGGQCPSRKFVVTLLNLDAKPYTWKLSPGENYCQFHHLFSLMKSHHANFLSCVKDYIEDMATFTALAKIYVSAIQVTCSWAWRNFCPVMYTVHVCGITTAYVG